MNHSSAAPNDNFDQAELDKFGALANRWWDPQGPQKALHALNPVRLDYVKQRIPLRDATVLDVGCGAGLLSEALAKEGASVAAIDLAPDGSTLIATSHSGYLVLLQRVETGPDPYAIGNSDYAEVGRWIFWEDHAAPLHW